MIEWLQSVDEPDIALMTMDPTRDLLLEYAPERVERLFPFAAMKKGHSCRELKNCWANRWISTWIMPFIARCHIVTVSPPVPSTNVPVETDPLAVDGTKAFVGALQDPGPVLDGISNFCKVPRRWWKLSQGQFPPEFLLKPIDWFAPAGLPSRIYLLLCLFSHQLSNFFFGLQNPW